MSVRAEESVGFGHDTEAARYAATYGALATPPLISDALSDLESGAASDDAPLRDESPLPFRQDTLWAALVLSFFGLLFAALLAFSVSAPFRRFVVANANALFTIPYVISFVVILACLAPWVPASGGSLSQMNAGVIASAADFLLILLVLVEWAVCLALMLVTLVAVHDGLSYISVDGVIVPRTSDAPRNGWATPLPRPDPGVGGIARNSPIILAVPILTLYATFNLIMHLFSCIEAIVRRRRGISDSE